MIYSILKLLINIVLSCVNYSVSLDRIRKLIAHRCELFTFRGRSPPAVLWTSSQLSSEPLIIVVGHVSIVIGHVSVFIGRHRWSLVVYRSSSVIVGRLSIVIGRCWLSLVVCRLSSVVASLVVVGRRWSCVGRRRSSNTLVSLRIVKTI